MKKYTVFILTLLAIFTVFAGCEKKAEAPKVTQPAVAPAPAPAPAAEPAAPAPAATPAPAPSKPAKK